MKMDMKTFSVLKSLKSTSKGKLSYDNDWYTSRRWQETIENCTSPPLLSFVSPKGQDGQSGEKSEIVKETRENSTSDSEGGSDEGNSEKTSHAIGISRPGLYCNKAITIAEDNWKNRTMMAIQHRQQLFEEHTAQLEREAQQQLLEVYLLQEDKAARHTTQVRINNQASSEEVQEKQQEIKEKHKKHAQRLRHEMVEAHRKQREEEEHQRKRMEVSERNLCMMLEHQQQLLTQLQRANQLLVSCVYPQHLNPSAISRPSLLAQVASTVDEVVTTARQNEVTQGHLQIVRDFCQKAQEVTDYIAGQVEEANKKGKEEELKQQELQEQQAKEQQQLIQKQQQVVAATQPSIPSSTTTNTTTTTTNLPSAASAVPTGPKDESVQQEVLECYKQLQQKLEQVDKDSEALLKEPQLKKLRFELQKAVNTAINAISPTSGSHLRDKWRRLVSLMSGQTLQSGSSTISASSHPAGVPFCKQLFARKIVKQGEEQVSSSQDSAFAIAAVAVGIWQKFPDVGELILACFYQKCPYLVPYYIPKRQEQSSDDYYRSLGYLYEGDACEKQDKFLKRMSGLVRLYAAIMVTNPPVGLTAGSQEVHPHGLEQGWSWMIRTMNLAPRPDITPTVLHDFLQVAGSSMLSTYGKQTVKLLRLLQRDYLAKMKEAGGSGGPITRMETLLQQCIHHGKMAPPKGMITSNFWLS